MDDFWSLVGLLVKSAKTPTRPCVALWEAHNALWTLVGAPQGLVGPCGPLWAFFTKMPTRVHEGPQGLVKATQGIVRPCGVLTRPCGPLWALVGILVGPPI